jgi:hypothetical protein
MAWNIVGTAEPERWSALLARLGAFDVYHLPGYHRPSSPRSAARSCSTR